MKIENRYYFKFGFLIFTFLLLVGVFLFYNFYAVRYLSQESMNSAWATAILLFTLFGIIFVSVAYSLFTSSEDSPR